MKDRLTINIVPARPLLLSAPEMRLNLPIPIIGCRSDLFQESAVADKVANFPKDSQPAAEKRHEVAFFPSPPGLSGQDGGMAWNRIGPGSHWNVSPKDSLLVA